MLARARTCCLICASAKPDASIQAQFNRRSHSVNPREPYPWLPKNDPLICLVMKLRCATLSLLAVLALSSHDAGAAPLTMSQAIAKVQRETHGKVLSAETKTQGKQEIYRIKVLTHEGQVRIVEVPAE